MARKGKMADSDCPIAFTLRTLFDMRPDLTQAHLADLCGVTRQTVGIWLGGQSVPDANALRKICVEFDVSADYLLGTEGMKNSESRFARKYFETMRKLNKIIMEQYR